MKDAEKKDAKKKDLINDLLTYREHLQSIERFYLNKNENVKSFYVSEFIMDIDEKIEDSINEEERLGCHDRKVVK